MKSRHIITLIVIFIGFFQTGYSAYTENYGFALIILLLTVLNCIFLAISMGSGYWLWI